MSEQKQNPEIRRVTGRAVYVPGNDIDTDRIIPARYLICVTFDDLAPGLFRDVRFNEDGSPKSHPLNETSRQGAAVLISDENFGCGSSREHAPQAIQKSGFQAVIAGSFAEIFYGNCNTLGMPCAEMTTGPRKELAAMVDADPQLEVELDVDRQEVRAGDKAWPVTIRAAARQSFLDGSWDPLSGLLEAKDQVRERAQQLRYI